MAREKGWVLRAQRPDEVVEHAVERCPEVRGRSEFRSAFLRLGDRVHEGAASIVVLCEKFAIAPTLVVNGSHDIVIPTSTPTRCNNRSPAAKLLIYPDSGQGAQFQYPADFVREATNFLEH
ncbi:MAG TPA: hypothetical protein VHZ98_16195 [Galbitalea sp.]|nr:hypothetical protein [Galbitalea sp.]